MSSRRMWTKEDFNSLQRRLDKPSAEWNSETSKTDLASWLEEHNLHEGQVVYVSHIYDVAWCIVSYAQDGDYIIVPLSISITDIGDDTVKIITTIDIDTTTNVVKLNYIGGEQQISMLDIDNFKLY